MYRTDETAHDCACHQAPTQAASLRGLAEVIGGETWQQMLTNVASGLIVGLIMYQIGKSERKGRR